MPSSLKQLNEDWNVTQIALDVYTIQITFCQIIDDIGEVLKIDILSETTCIISCSMAVGTISYNWSWINKLRAYHAMKIYQIVHSLEAVFLDWNPDIRSSSWYNQAHVRQGMVDHTTQLSALSIFIYFIIIHHTLRTYPTYRYCVFGLRRVYFMIHSMKYGANLVQWQLKTIQ